MKENRRNTVEDSSERGAALLSVLMMVAAMSVAAITAIDALARTVHISRAGQLRSDAVWAIRSAEAYGQSYLAEIFALTSGRLVANTPGFGEPQVFSTPRFDVSATLEPAGNCFNLNALAVTSDGGGVTINETEYAQYLALLTASGLFQGDARALADGLADWMDGDDETRASGAESRMYQAETLPYRTSGQMLANLSELRAIKGYVPETMDKLDGLICAYPTTSQNKLNINLLTSEQAPLLTALFSSQLSVDAARGLIETRPVNGWIGLEEFLDLDGIRQIAETARMQENVTLETRYFELRVDVISPDQSAYGDYLFEVLPEQGIQTLWRREGGER